MTSTQAVIYTSNSACSSGCYTTINTVGAQHLGAGERLRCESGTQGHCDVGSMKPGEPWASKEGPVLDPVNTETPQEMEPRESKLVQLNPPGHLGGNWEYMGANKDTQVAGGWGNPQNQVTLGSDEGKGVTWGQINPHTHTGGGRGGWWCQMRA